MLRAKNNAQVQGHRTVERKKIVEQQARNAHARTLHSNARAIVRCACTCDSVKRLGAR